PSAAYALALCPHLLISSPVLCTPPSPVIFFVSCHSPPRDLHSFPTRRSSDLMVGVLSEEEKRSLITEVLTPIGYNMMVTPKEVDGFMVDMAHLLASGINAALHEAVDVDNLAFYSR